MTDSLPIDPDQLSRDAQKLSQLVSQLSQVTSQVAGTIAAQQKTDPATLSPIDKALGGQALVGLKTPLAIVSYAALWIMQAFGAVGTVSGDKATTTGSVLSAIISAFGSLGLTAKFDRAIKTDGVIANVLKSFGGLK